MAGHSKWANIKHRKAAQDAKKGKVNTKFIKIITIAARDGGGDLDMNSSLRMIVQKAKKAGVPNDKIDRGIKVGTGELKGEAEIIEIIYEGYGPGGVAILIQSLTDNKNRSVASVRHILSKNEGSMGNAGCVAYLFDYKGVFVFTDEKKTEIEEFAIMNDAEDILEEEGSIIIYTKREDYGNFSHALEAVGLEAEHSELEYVAKTDLDVSDEDREKVQNLIDLLEEDDDVQNVYTNIS